MVFVESFETNSSSCTTAQVPLVQLIARPGHPPTGGAGDKRSYADMIKPDGLAESPSTRRLSARKTLIIPTTSRQTPAATTLVSDAHKSG